MSQYRLLCARDGADSTLVYVTAGVVVLFAPLPFGRKLFSSTSFDKLRDACARLGCRLEPLADWVGVDVPLVERPLSSICIGVAVPLLSCGVTAMDASLREASPTMVLMFLLRRWLGRQWAFR